MLTNDVYSGHACIPFYGQKLCSIIQIGALSAAYQDAVVY